MSLSDFDVRDNLRPYGNVDKAPRSSGSSLQREHNRTRAHDAIHSYLIEVAEYDQQATAPAYLRAVLMLEEVANSLAQRQAEQDNR